MSEWHVGQKIQTSIWRDAQYFVSVLCLLVAFWTTVAVLLWRLITT
jgi:hypothetical protein